jgi:hypothetical protein
MKSNRNAHQPTESTQHFSSSEIGSHVSKAPNILCIISSKFFLPEVLFLAITNSCLSPLWAHYFFLEFQQNKLHYS